MTQPSAIVHARGTAMLKSALGPAIAAWLDDGNISEIMLNADGRLWVDWLDSGMAATKERLTASAAKAAICSPSWAEAPHTLMQTTDS
ncbi:hypothetical protein [Sphingobium sp.]|uniref:hypothetical protein n=1 Tax=Sphingobium sp. TaxID=1912891 RepID=UPI0028BD4507|nr:hypothetical protein [Sphingobium sp.]